MNTEDTIRTVLSAYRSKDITRVMSLVHEQIRFRNNSVGGCDTWNINCACKSELAEALTMINSEIEILDYELLEIVSQNDRAATRQLVTMKSREDGEVVQMEISGFWTVTDGKITDLMEYQDTATIARVRIPMKG